MVDYQKLYLDLYGKLTEVKDELDKIQSDSYREFSKSKPTLEEVRCFSKNLELANKKHFEK